LTAFAFELELMNFFFSLNIPSAAESDDHNSQSPGRLWSEEEEEDKNIFEYSLQ
jgi:hypothetical protein